MHKITACVNRQLAFLVKQTTLSRGAYIIDKTHYRLLGVGGTQHGGTLASHFALAFRLPFPAMDCIENGIEYHIVVHCMGGRAPPMLYIM